LLFPIFEKVGLDLLKGLYEARAMIFFCARLA